jgi:PAS domain S-box-containing protein
MTASNQTPEDSVAFERGRVSPVQGFLMKKEFALISFSDLLIFATVLAALIASSFYSYILFHSLVETVSVVIAGMIFFLAWNSRRIIDRPFFGFLGIGFLFVGSLDLLHSLAYFGMGVFPGYGPNLPTQLWISARLLSCLSLFIAFGFIDRKVNYPAIFLAFGTAFSLFLVAIFFCNLFPVCYIKGLGLTPFKKYSEYAICAILLLTVPLLWKRRQNFDPGVLLLLIASLILMILSELTFTLYIRVYDVFNMIGHLFKLTAYYFIYKALIETGFVNPYNLLFLDLRQSEESLRRGNEELEYRVQQRTAQLVEANRALQAEILERRHAEEALREAERKYGRLVENSLTGIFINQGGKIVFANQRFAEIYGYNREEIEGIENQELVHPDDRALIAERQDRRLRGEEVPSEYESRGLTKDGRTIWVTRRNTLIEYQEKSAILGNIVETTERRRIEESLQESQRGLRVLSSQLLAAQENERKWIAHELHDSIGQTLAAVKFSLERKISQMDAGKAPPGTLLEDILTLLKNGIEETRRIMTNLRPAILDDLGILPTINWFCREFEKVYTHIQVHKETPIAEEDVPDNLKTVIFRILQEGMNNFAKHGNGDSVFVSLSRTGRAIELEIRDNRVGFEPEATRKGFGLSSMKERAELAGGVFTLESAKGQGTRIRAKWPI